MPVRITKTAGIPNPLVRTGSWEEFRPGYENETSLPVDYEITGELLTPIVPGRPVRCWRDSRNGVMADGLFTSTIVFEVLVRTWNSEYRITAVGERLPSEPDTMSELCAIASALGHTVDDLLEWIVAFARRRKRPGSLRPALDQLVAMRRDASSGFTGPELKAWLERSISLNRRTPLALLENGALPEVAKLLHSVAAKAPTMNPEM